MTYEVKMSDGGCAEAESLAGAMLAARTLHTDAGGGTFVRSVTVHSASVQPLDCNRMATWACRVHVLERTGSI